MKALLFTVSMLTMLTMSQATVVVVDATGLGDYTTIADGISNTLAGDTIYVAGSSASYGNVTLNTERTFIGNGYFGQSIGYWPSSTLGTITLNSGAANSVFSNLEIGAITFNESNVSFDACLVMGSFTIGTGNTNISFSRCLFTSVLYVQNATTSFTNCIFNYSGTGNILNVSGGVSPSFDYCTFFDGNLSLDVSTITNAVVNTTRVVQTPTLAMDGVNGNKVDAEANLLFESALDNDAYFQLQGGSPGKTSSQSGGESGAFGYPIGLPENAYILRGLPALPKVISLEHQSSSNSSSGLTIHIQATNN